MEDDIIDLDFSVGTNEKSTELVEQKTDPLIVHLQRVIENLERKLRSTVNGTIEILSVPIYNADEISQRIETILFHQFKTTGYAKVIKSC